MKKSLEWLKARSAQIVLQPKAVEIARKANSPTDAFNLARSSGYFYDDDAELVRYLAVIKRDFGALEFDNFAESACNISVAKTFLDMLIPAISILEFSKICPAILMEEEISTKLAPLLKEIRRMFDSEFQQLIFESNSEYATRCKDYYCRYVCQIDFLVRISEVNSDLRYDIYGFEKIFTLLLTMGWSVGEKYGIYFMRTPPSRILHNF